MKRVIIALMIIAFLLSLVVSASTVPVVVDESGCYVTGASAGKVDEDLLKKSNTSILVNTSISSLGILEILQMTVEAMEESKIVEIVAFLCGILSIIGLGIVGGALFSDRH